MCAALPETALELERGLLGAPPPTAARAAAADDRRRTAAGGAAELEALCGLDNGRPPGARRSR